MSISEPEAIRRVPPLWTLAWALLIAVLLVQPSTAGPQHVLKIASLAPEGSAWVEAARAIDAEVRAQTGGMVGLKIYPSGVQGDEPVVLRKIRIGQLHGSGFAGLGLSTICPDVLALEVPFLFDNYAEIDYVLDQMDAFYHARITSAGYVLLGWFDLGFVHLLSGTPVSRVADITGRKVWRLENEPLTEVLFRKAGVTSVPLTIPDVLLGLQTRMVDVVYAPPAAAIALQWFTRVKYITELPINYTLGAMLIARRPFERISPQHQAVLREICGRHLHALTGRMRADNEEAMRVMLANGLQLVTPDRSAVLSFQKLVQESIPEWVGTSFSAAAHEQIRFHLDSYRTSPTPAQP
jgi:TRAP-type transport system periplasmic protein